MVVGGQWYASGTLWTAAGVVVALVVGVVTLLIAWVPRQRLFYAMPRVTPLLWAPSGMRSNLELRHCGTLLTEPRLVEVVLTSRGRGDILSSSFDGGRPLTFDLHAPVVEILQIVCEPASAPKPPVAYDGSLLRVGPELISHRQTITISALVDSPTPHLVCTEAPLANVTVTGRDLEPRAALRRALLEGLEETLSQLPGMQVVVRLSTALARRRGR